MWRALGWIFAWLLAILFTLGVRPFIPALLPFEPCIPLLVLSVTLGRPRIIIPLIILAGVTLDAFQPFSGPIALLALLGLALLTWLTLRFLLASRSFYSAVIMTIVARLLIAGLISLLGSEYALWSGDRAVFTPGFLVLTILLDALFLLIGFRIISHRLSGVRRETMLR